ncbi:hypothetical protein ACFC52_13690, partial [Enterococcus faecalis]|uniref:hypothetical protein n=1 Tax=Enterococcus faecalis TaxID=1351 RepID=UPI0035D7E7CC
GYDNHVFLKLFSFELSHLHSSKLSFSIILPQNELIGNFATEPGRAKLLSNMDQRIVVRSFNHAN